MTEWIEVAGARENNLKNVSLRVPKRQITVFTGVSGSGKSSLVFDTIAAEAQRQLNETFTAFARNYLPRYGRPDVDLIENLSAAIIVDQRRLGGNSRSTVGTITDLYALLRLLFSRAGRPHAGYSNAFSFNDPQGMCPECEGLGRVVTVDLDRFLDRSRSLNEGALLHPGFAVGGMHWGVYALSGFFDLDKRLADYSPEEWRALLYGADAKVPLTWQGGTINAKYEGVVEKFTRLYIKRDVSEMSERNQEVVRRFTKSVTCEACGGARLNPAALESRVNGLNIAEMAAMEAERLVAVLGGVTEPSVAPVVASLRDRLSDLVAIGLGYLSLDRETTTLSGGESQRVKMVRHLSSSLTDMMYVFDEPSVGLHPRDVHRMTELLVKLRDKGNTVLVVEHDPDVIACADHVVDLGPQAGSGGGHVVFQGAVEGLRRADTLTGRCLRLRRPLKTAVRRPTGALRVEDASAHNLKHLTVDVPTGVLTVITGVAGAGKSTLTGVFLGRHPDTIVIDQSAVSTSRRSNIATYTGLLDEIRRLFARANGVSPSLFSTNSTGACPECQGLGVIYTDLAFMDGLKTVCEVCAGRRFKPDVLAHTLRGRTIADVLEMTAAEAADFFPEKRLHPVLRALTEVGLDYITLGQPLSTLSGGECQRVKLATELHRSARVYLLDEPTTGLHMSDVTRLLTTLDRLVDEGNTVVVVEHDLDVVRHADWIIDLGPEGGAKGGEILFQGTPAGLLSHPTSHTARHLRHDLSP
ncbi:excinuclease ABC subunit UvrA [Bailinhaonella thermotolerans]|uniref:UvrABC system protein A n=1 Tax=Bailinhaonella thermotolerans TaxID=1070861 RepID=A0A3A4AZV6_9ACTN|nr:excinuclease ABC subunit UvrA [Bailinhaonella thermotolerans]